MHHNYHDNSNHSFTTFLVGALTGVAAVLLLDKDVRTKVENKILEARLKGEEEVERAKDKIQQTKEKIVDKADEKLMEAHEKVEEERATRQMPEGSNNRKNS